MRRLRVYGTTHLLHDKPNKCIQREIQPEDRSSCRGPDHAAGALLVDRPNALWRIGSTLRRHDERLSDRRARRRPDTLLVNDVGVLGCSRLGSAASVAGLNGQDAWRHRVGQRASARRERARQVGSRNEVGLKAVDRKEGIIRRFSLTRVVLPRLCAG
jgi:hypothetical protein